MVEGEVRLLERKIRCQWYVGVGFRTGGDDGEKGNRFMVSGCGWEASVEIQDAYDGKKFEGEAYSDGKAWQKKQGKTSERRGESDKRRHEAKISVPRQMCERCRGSPAIIGKSDGRS